MSFFLHRLSHIFLCRFSYIIATGRYLGEGFDYARLDTLFLAMPISWNSRISPVRVALPARDGQS